MIGIELHAGAKQLAETLLTEHHIVVNVTGNEVIRLLPPLIWTEAEVNELIHALEHSLNM